MLFIKSIPLLRHYRAVLHNNYDNYYFSLIKRCYFKYKQGQYDETNPSIREYFYYIDHQGMLFLDDSKMKNFTSCFKEKKFLQFFFSRLRRNETGKYEDLFPFLSPCGRERNYIRCDDKPIVFTHIIHDKSTGKQLLSYGHADDLLTVEFQPEKLCMPESGRVYHPASDDVGGVGLIKSSFAFELSKYFKFDNNLVGNQNIETVPTHFIWNGITYKLTNELLSKI